MGDKNATTRIVRWGEIPHREQLHEELDAIFFEASGTKSFADDEARVQFRDRWFGRYLREYPQWAYLAITGDGEIAGYLVGAIDEPTSFDDFRAAAERFPAHLHVNLAPQFRSRGVGALLIEAFAAAAAQAGAPGMHVVTSSDARNVRFYRRTGFSPQATTLRNGHELVFLGRPL
ncbi:GNAT family N-acetyltransferase [Hyphomicrobium sp. D-2]|uniref:GNAT family N-acetyltransferase n=1 Tax=Hyphomicrobium sp. D-2 TaxID=3041621 RepID=UPI00245390ED|nr:GNAT family N-acetyltransferase [Hyphomicrobium sp. D-2]MDH4982678.1 GNAT family N-acetyltransferase [Hyphomicrobium sp. D-2]